MFGGLFNQNRCLPRMKIIVAYFSYFCRGWIIVGQYVSYFCRGWIIIVAYVSYFCHGWIIVGQYVSYFCIRTNRLNQSESDCIYPLSGWCGTKRNFIWYIIKRKTINKTIFLSIWIKKLKFLSLSVPHWKRFRPQMTYFWTGQCNPSKLKQHQMSQYSKKRYFIIEPNFDV